MTCLNLNLSVQCKMCFYCIAFVFFTVPFPQGKDVFHNLFILLLFSFLFFSSYSMASTAVFPFEIDSPLNYSGLLIDRLND